MATSTHRALLTAVRFAAAATDTASILDVIVSGVPPFASASSCEMRRA